ncbi:MAG: hypothetical protein QOJ20_5037 [Mycobacterium sp.]|jgi:hypothetical protein|nr:hypothetical protein [Mycobacterium sp.]MDT5283842.1 hypothetical protein [Mycobacterium sp.]
MNLKRLIGSVAIAGVVGASTLGIGTGIANAAPTQSNSGTATVQPVGWHGGGYWGHGGGYGRGWGHGYGHDFRGGWGGDRWWHPWRW